MPILAESINAQLDNGILVRSFPFWRRNMPVAYDMTNNKIYINYDSISYIMPMLKKVNPINSEKDNYKSIFKNEFIQIMSGILFYAIQSYNVHNRGALAKHEITLNWYKQFFYMLVYTFNKSDSPIYVNVLTTSVAKRIAELFYRPYLQIVLQYFELLGYKGVTFGEDQEKKLDFMFTQLKEQIKNELEKNGLAEFELSVFDSWFRSFITDFKVCFRNSDRIILKQDSHFMKIQEFKCLNLKSFQSAYYGTAPYMPLMVDEDGVKNKWPTSAFLELINTGAVLSTVLSCGVYDYKKLRNVEDLQKLAARGIALLG